jgi:subtilisin family serine protease
MVAITLASLVLSGCGSTSLVSTPIENIDTVPLKVSELSREASKRWGHADLMKDTVPGMSVDRAYEELLGKLKVREDVVVAVIDAGIDLEHEDLDGVIWLNTDEISGNGKDDDNNGYIDDVHGYNFLGGSYHEQMEMARILRLKLGDADLQERARRELSAEYEQARSALDAYEQYYPALKDADEAVKKVLGKDSYTKEDVVEISGASVAMQQAKGILIPMFGYGSTNEEVLKFFKTGLDYLNAEVNYHLNVEFNGREVVGDDPYDINSRDYGNGNPMNLVEDESHGTHVAGIIAAERGNGLGVDGVADHVKIMSIRTVPDGDEYDKDVALAIRYAADNGARIINASFGKSYSPNKEWVYEAIKYAARKNVLIVHAAGNDGLDLDDPANPNFPNDQEGTGPEFTDNVLTVGSLDNAYGSEMVSSFSNYGANNVDIFAPGGEIYSTMPGNQYAFQGGTSMAAPAVSGIAALILSRFPKLTAAQMKKIIMQSGLTVKAPVIVAGNADLSKPLTEISRSGKIANAYNALILAEQVANGNISL